MKFLTKRNWIITGTSIILACLMVLSGVQVGRTLDQKGSLTIGQGFPTIRIGMAGVAAAGTADYTCTGTNDDVIVQAALNSLPSNGGKLTFLSGNYSFSSTVTRLIPNVTIEGNGASTKFTFDGSTPLFTAGGNSWSFQDFVTDAGGVSMGATINWSWLNLNGQTYISTLNTTTLNAPTGRGVAITVASVNASAQEKAQANYVCNGTAYSDGIVINQAIVVANLTKGQVRLTEGNFYIGSGQGINLVSGVSVSGASFVAYGGNTTIGTTLIGDGTSHIFVHSGSLENLSLELSNMKLINSSNSSLASINDTNGQLLSLRNLELFGGALLATNETANYTASAIYVSGGEQYWYSNVYIHNTPRSGLYLENVGSSSLYRVKVDNSAITNGSLNTPAATSTGGGILIKNSHQVTIDTGEYGSIQYANGIRCVNSYDIKIINSRLWDNGSGSGANGGYRDISYELGAGSGGLADIVNNSFAPSTLPDKANHAIVADAPGVIATGNVFNSPTSYTSGTPVLLVGSGDLVYRNILWITENSGSTTVIQNTNTISVSHGLSTTPTNIQVTFGGNTTGYVIAIGASTFNITTTTNVTANTTAYWRATAGAGN